MRIVDWISDVCSSDLGQDGGPGRAGAAVGAERPLVAAAARPGHRDGVGLDARAPAGAGTDGRTAAHHLRPRRLGRTDRDDRRSEPAGKLDHPRQRRRAAALVLTDPAQGAGPAPRRPRGGGRGVKRFAALIDRLVYTRSRNSKLALIVDYLRHTPDPDRGWTLAALTEIGRAPV